MADEAAEPVNENERQAADDPAVSGARHSAFYPEQLRQRQGRASVETPRDQCVHRVEQAKLQAHQPGYRDDQQGDVHRAAKCDDSAAQHGRGRNDFDPGEKLRKIEVMLNTYSQETDEREPLYYSLYVYDPDNAYFLPLITRNRKSRGCISFRARRKNRNGSTKPFPAKGTVI